MKLTGKIALVTGASRGIGRGIAVELAGAGAEVIINYGSDEQGAEETRKAIESKGGYATCFRADISEYHKAQGMIDHIVQKFGKIDILINNAGISIVGIFTDMQQENWDKLIDVNIKGVINCSHCALKSMLSNKSGSIVNISSIWGNTGASCEVIYSATKGAINSFTKALAKEMAPSGIRVNAIAPGVIDTSMNDIFSEEEKNNLIQEIPMLRLGTANEVGKLALFLSSDDSSYITGQVITIDGGML